jgi:hypothetical protein
MARAIPFFFGECLGGVFLCSPAGPFPASNSRSFSQCLAGARYIAPVAGSFLRRGAARLRPLSARSVDLAVSQVPHGLWTCARHTTSSPPAIGGPASGEISLRCAWGSSVLTTRFGSLGCYLTLIPPRSHSPYGTQMFFTWWACSRYHRPSPCLSLKKSISRPSFVHTCFKFPTDSPFAVAHISSSP